MANDKTPAPQRAGTTTKLERVTKIAARLVEMSASDPDGFAEMLQLIGVLEQQELTKNK